MVRLNDVVRQIAASSAFLQRMVATALREPPLASAAALEAFVGTRAAFVAQTQLFGCLKGQDTKRFRDFFEDSEISVALRDCSTSLCEACLSDLSIYAAARVAAVARTTDQDAATLARRCFRAGLGRAETDEPALRRRSAEAAFEARLTATNWTSAALGDAAFTESAATLLRNVAALESVAALDRACVLASMRERWAEVRGQFERRLQAVALAATMQADQDRAERRGR